MDTIYFWNTQNLTLSICVTDEYGCSTCETQIVTFPYDCELALNAVLTDNLITLSPTVSMNGINSYEFDGTVTINSGAISNVSTYQTVQSYISNLGISEVCLTLEDWSLESYPNCPPSVCETVDVIAYSYDCSAAFGYSQNAGEISFVNTSTGFYDGVVWDFGNGEVSTQWNPYVNLNAGVYMVTLTTTSTLSSCSSTYQEAITVASPAHICMNVYDDENQNGVQDNGEGPVDSLAVYWGNQQWLILDGVLDVYTNPGSGCIQFGGEWDMVVITELPNWNSCFMPGTYMLDLAEGDELCPIEIGVFIPQAHICGTYYFDANNNAVMDSNESGISFSEIQVEFQDQIITLVTDENGLYCVDLPIYTGAWFTPLFEGESSPLIQPNNYVLYTTPEPTILNFGLYQTMDNLDVGISMSQGGSVTPGFGTIYYLTIQNYSNLPTSILVNVYNALGQATEYVSNGGSVTVDGATWNVDLPAYGTINLLYTVMNEVTMALGDMVFNQANVMPVGVDPDDNLDNNTYTLQSQVIGSYDPNNKLVNPAGEGPTGRISPSVDSFEYTINFQNTGTAPAVNVRVEDDLPVELDPTTIQLLNTSHPATMIVNGPHVEWNFYDIQLPDSISNEAESHGHLTFRIAPANPLVDGMEISNSASIYFDFNEPIVTAPALLTVDETIGVGDQLDEKSLIVFPNPVEGDIIYLPGIEGLVHVYDAAGRVVQTARLSKLSSKMTIVDLKPGLYLIKEIESGIGAAFVRQ